MALETLIDFEKIDGFDVGRTAGNYLPEELSKFVIINDDTNTICFKVQNGPIKEVGVNGCQVDTIIKAAKLIIEGLNNKCHCHENDMASVSLQDALSWLDFRKEKLIRWDGYDKP